MGRVRKKPEPLWISLFRLVKKATAASNKPPLPAGAASAASTAPNLILKALRCGSLQTESLRYAADSFSHLLLPNPTSPTSAARTRRRRRALPSPSPRCFSRPQTDSFRVHHVVDQEALTHELDFYEDFIDASVSRSSSAATSSATCSATTSSASNTESYITAPSTFADRLSSISSGESSPRAGMLISSSDEEEEEEEDDGGSCFSSRCRISDAGCSARCGGDADGSTISDAVELLSDNVLTDFTVSVVEMVMGSRLTQEEQLEALFFEYLRLNPAELHATIALAFVHAVEILADAANSAYLDSSTAVNADSVSSSDSCAVAATPRRLPTVRFSLQHNTPLLINY